MPHKTQSYKNRMLMLKTTLYRLVSTPALVAILLAVTGDLALSLTAGAVELLCKGTIYFLFEKFWDLLSYKIELWKKYSE